MFSILVNLFIFSDFDAIGYHACSNHNVLYGFIISHSEVHNIFSTFISN